MRLRTPQPTLRRLGHMRSLWMHVCTNQPRRPPGRLNNGANSDLVNGTDLCDPQVQRNVITYLADYDVLIAIMAYTCRAVCPTSNMHNRINYEEWLRPCTVGRPQVEPCGFAGVRQQRRLASQSRAVAAALQLDSSGREDGTVIGLIRQLVRATNALDHRDSSPFVVAGSTTDRADGEARRDTLKRLLLQTCLSCPRLRALFWPRPMRGPSSTR